MLPLSYVKSALSYNIVLRTWTIWTSCKKTKTHIHLLMMRWAKSGKYTGGLGKTCKGEDREKATWHLRGSPHQGSYLGSSGLVQVGTYAPITTKLGQTIISHLTQWRTHTSHTMPGNPFGFLEAACSVFRNTALTYLLGDKENCQQIQADVQASLLLGQYHQWAIQPGTPWY